MKEMNWIVKEQESTLALKEMYEVPFFTYEHLENTGMVVHGFSTRMGGVSTGDCATMNLSFERGDAEEVEDNKLFAISTLMYNKVYFVEFDGESGILKYGKDSNNLTEVSLKEVGTSEYQSLFGDRDILKIYYGSFLNQNCGKNEFTVAVTDKNCLMKISNTDNLIPLTILNNN